MKVSKSKIKNKLSRLTAIIFLLTVVFFQCREYNKKDKENPYPIAWDVYGYYLYLPAAFIYHDLFLQNEEWITKTRNKYNPSPTFYQVTSGEGNKKVIIYNIGYSFIYAPGFLIANQLANFFGYDADGFSKPYQISLVLNALLFTLVGVIMFRKISLQFFSDKVSSLLIFTILLGTNYFYQVTFDGVMPHNILFTLNCCIIWFTIKWHQNQTTKNSVFLALSLGIATLCRPTELIWILLPVFWGVFDKKRLAEKWRLILRFKNQVFLFSILLSLIVFIQFLYFKLSTGYFRVLNLHNESFSFLDPYTAKFLFSYKKGWLLYTPMMLFGIIGFYQLSKQNKKIYIALTSFFIINLYVVSSWECWWYATSFSQRPMVESYAMMLFPMGYLFDWIYTNKHRWLVNGFSLILIAIVFLNLFQTWQFLNYIIDGERMTKKYYWKVFGKTTIDEKEKQFLSIDHSQNNFDVKNYQDHFLRKKMFHLTFETPNEKRNKIVIDTTSTEGNSSLLINAGSQYSEAFEKKFSEITKKSYVWIRVSTSVYLTAPPSESNSAIVISIESNGKLHKYLASNYENYNIKPHEWKEIHLDFLTPEIIHENDIVKAYFWNMGNKDVLIDDFKVDVFEPKNE